MSETLSRSTPVTFVVEEAGCDSCASRVRSSLEPLGEVQTIDVDHEADSSTVTVLPVAQLSEQSVNGALRDASAGTSHTYRVKPGSWSDAG